MAMSSMVVNTIQKNLGYNSGRGPHHCSSVSEEKVSVRNGLDWLWKISLIHRHCLPLLGEVINSDKMQVYKGLDIITNKMAESDRRGVPHHLIGEVEPDVDFTAEDFCMAATSAIERIVEQGRVPIIVGGSNSFVEALVQNPSVEFKSRYEPCFIWLNVAPPILDTYLSKRSIGVPEMDAYLRADRMVGYIERETLLKEAIDDIKANTCKLAKADAAWEMLVKKPTFGIIDSFLT
ncbi:Adenylate isopentenyltransferase 3, chloroplastic [Vitis vinifera]|uniref:Adenylate isopentenyltransferase 3, chloroplastic n=1 Tax=Vitis vinifera TaxID=29760 RepID=A0A438BY12_VITVI|nr:Adenylate isopentenyltransferase 3, chloroplastic [Vitis vinifera]